MITRKFRRATDAERRAMEHAFSSAVLRDGQAATDHGHARYEPPKDVEPRTWGSVIRGLQAKGLIRRVAEFHTQRAIAHGRRVGLFEAVDSERLRLHVERLAAATAQKRPAQLEGEADPTTEVGPAL